MNFNKFELEETICRALDGLGYTEVLPVQNAVIPRILERKDVIVKSKTGSGKTAAFVIPIIQDIIWDERSPQAIVIAPTRELALQIKADFDNIGIYKRIKSIALFGKHSFHLQVQDLRQRAHVVVATPGRLLDHLENQTIRVDQIRYLVLDEADEMLNMGFIDAIKQIMEYLPSQRTTCLFSATMPEAIQDLANTFMDNAKLIEIEQESKITNQVEHYAYSIKEQDKLEFLMKLLCNEKPETCIIFGKTREHVDDVFDCINRKGCSVNKLHGGMEQVDRIANINAFKRGEVRILVATDVASRGIDIENVTHIINFDMPEKPETYVHRIGRAGRKEATGVAISFVGQFDNQRIEELEVFLNQPLTIKSREKIDTLRITRDRLDSLGVPTLQKEEKGKTLRQSTVKIYINVGKAKKFRPANIVGMICEIDGVIGDDIGVINVQENQSYVDILNNKGEMVIKALQSATFKGKKLKIQRAKDTNEF